MNAVLEKSVHEVCAEEQVCRAIIRVEDVEFRVHKLALCSCSSYFKALFTRWTGPQQMLYTFSGLSSHTMALIIDFAYTGCLPLTKENVKDLLLAADMLLINGIVRSCFKFLVEHLCPENCIGILQLTNDVFPRSELQCSTFRYITDHFESVVPCEEFLQLTVQELAEILGRDELNVKKENTVYEAILRWIAHKPEEREEHIDVLLPKIRLALTSLNYIKRHVISNDLVKKSAACLRRVNDVVRFMERRRNTVCYTDKFACPRLPNAILLAIGGWRDRSQLDTIESYDCRVGDWIMLGVKMIKHRAYHGSAFLGGSVYFIGGYEGDAYCEDVWRLDLSTQTWHEMAPMHSARCYVSVTVLNGFIYSLGGFDGLNRHKTAERYSPATNQWSFIAEMTHKRSDAGCSALHDKIYICGGYTGQEFLYSAECYNPQANQWTVIANMNVRRSGIGVVAFAGQIYAIGGYTGTKRVTCVEAYNHETNTWQYRGPMKIPRSNFGLGVIEEQLYVVGGYSRTSITDVVECYNRTENKWSMVPVIRHQRSALSCCVVSGILNIAKYVFSRDSLPDTNRKS